MEKKEVISALLGGRYVVLVGPPGVGKTAFALSLASEISKLLKREVKLIQLWAPQLTILHFGAPVVVEGEKKEIEFVLSNTILPLFQNNFAKILIVEDIGASSPEIHAFLLGLLDSTNPNICGHPLPSDTFVILTSNMGISALTSILPPLANRCFIFNFEPDFTAWPQDFLNYWNNEKKIAQEMSFLGEKLEAWLEKWRKWRAVVASFILSYPNYLYTREPEEIVFPSPRGWDFLTRALALSEICGHLEEDEIYLLAQARVGKETAVAFVQFLKELSLPPLEEIAEKFESFAPAMQFFACSHINQTLRLMFSTPVHNWSQEYFQILLHTRKILSKCMALSRVDYFNIILAEVKEKLIKNWDRIKKKIGLELLGKENAFFDESWNQVVFDLLALERELK